MAAISYDPEADALYVTLAPGVHPDAEGEELHPGVTLMFDKDGRLIGIEILPASKVLPAGAVAQLPLAAE